MFRKYGEALNGTREAATAEKAKILRDALRYEPKNQLVFSLNIAQGLCATVVAKGVHYDIYCDILETLTGTVDPSSSAKYWSNYLEFVRYMQYLMIEKQQNTEAARIYYSLYRRTNKLQNEGDYKYILHVYCQHLLAHRSTVQGDATAAAASKDISHTLGAITGLFVDMLRCNTELNFTYPDLISQFVQCLLPKRSLNVFNFLSALPEIKKDMYDSFFKLLSTMKTAQATTEEVKQQCQKHLSAFLVFLQMDGVDKMQQQVALQHMRVCRELPLFQGDKAVSFLMACLYYYVKLAYSQHKVNNFARTYVDICGKFSSFFEKNGELLMQDKWCMDMLVLLNLLHSQMQRHASTCFQVFWQQMNSVECYGAYFGLNLSCMKCAPHITETQLTSWECCSSARKHTTLAFAQTSLTAYWHFLQNVTQDKLESDLKALSGLNKAFAAIMRYAIHVMDSMVCITESSNDLIMFHTNFGKLLYDVSSPMLARYFLTLAELFVKIQNKFSTSDWTLLLRRLYKTSLVADDHKMTAVLQCGYIASLLKTSTPHSLDLTLLSNQIGIFYNLSLNAKNSSNDKCILDIYEHSSSVFKPSLEPKHKRLLHWLETQHIMRYHRDSVELKQSLLQYSQTQYDYVVVAGKLKSPKAEVTEKLSEICAALRHQAKQSAGLPRLCQLTLAHAASIFFVEKNIVLKKQLIDVFDQNVCQEGNLEQLLQRKELFYINVTKEMEQVENALNILHAFEEFYNKADLELISSDDAYIDWELIVTDLVTIAQFLQFSGYIGYATRAWLLHYRVCNTIEDTYSSLRALAYFCEHADHLEHQELGFDVQQELASKQEVVLHMAENLLPLLARYQNYVLVCLCQLAHFYARQGNLSYAKILLQLVQQKHRELPERQGKYDLVCASREAVTFRVLWKLVGNNECDPHEEAHFMQTYLQREIELTLDSLKDFVYISSTDSIPLMMMLFSLLQEFAECMANRLCDNFLNGCFMSVLKCALQSGAALRTVQTLTTWMWTNLQMELVKKAQTKLQIIECILGVKSLAELTQPVQSKTPMMKVFQQSETTLETLSWQLNPGMETMRRVVQVYTSPIYAEKLQLNSMETNRNLKRFLKSQNIATLKHSEILQWTYFTVGCLNARLLYLIEDHDQLEDFYENCFKWLQQRSSKKHVSRIYQNIQLLCMQHYINYLRAHKKHEKALSCIENALTSCKDMVRQVDSIYRINFLLQLQATKAEMLGQQKTSAPTRSKLRRALEFNSPTEDSTEMPKAQEATTGSSKQTTPVAPPVTTFNGSGGSGPKPRVKSVQRKQVKGKGSAILSKLHLNAGEEVIEIDLELCGTDELIAKTTDNLKNLKLSAEKVLPLPKDKHQNSAVKVGRRRQPQQEPQQSSIDLNDCQVIDIHDLDDTVADELIERTVASLKNLKLSTVKVPEQPNSAVKSRNRQKTKSQSNSSSGTGSTPEPQTEVSKPASKKASRTAVKVSSSKTDATPVSAAPRTRGRKVTNENVEPNTSCTAISGDPSTSNTITRTTGRPRRL